MESNGTRKLPINMENSHDTGKIILELLKKYDLKEWILIIFIPIIAILTCMTCLKVYLTNKPPASNLIPYPLESIQHGTEAKSTGTNTTVIKTRRNSI